MEFNLALRLLMEAVHPNCPDSRMTEICNAFTDPKDMAAAMLVLESGITKGAQASFKPKTPISERNIADAGIVQCLRFRNMLLRDKPAERLEL